MANRLTLAQLNELQARWDRFKNTVHSMVPSNALAVLDGMQDHPRLYLKVNEEQTMANVIWDGKPLWSEPLSVSDGLRTLEKINPCGRIVYTDVAWCWDIGQWVEIKEEHRL